MKTLDVRVSGQPVGKIEQVRAQGHYFEPADDWLRGDQSPLLSLFYRQHLGKRGNPMRSTHLPIWFENLLPERGCELRRILCAHLSLKEGKSFELLAAMGRELPGAVVVTPSDHADTGFDESEVAAAKHNALRFSSLGGAQLKFSMAKDGTRFTLPVRSDDSEWILKIPSTDMPLLPQIEFATMQWAAATGLDVPECQIVPVGNITGLEAFIRREIADAFAIQRYDRTASHVRIHQEDFAQVLNLMPDHKYGDQGIGASMTTVAKLVRDACVVTDLNKLIARFAFIVASGNGDAHLKNWSFTYPDATAVPTLAPCYDQVCTIAVDPQRFGWADPGGPQLALKLGGAKHFVELSRTSLQRLGASLGTLESFEDRFTGALEHARDVWPQVAQLAPVSMRLALAHHWRRVPLLRDVGGWRE